MGFLTAGGATRKFGLATTSNQASVYNIRTQALAAGLGSTEVGAITVLVNSGVQLQAGMDTGTGWPTGCSIVVENNGTIAGVGGAVAQVVGRQLKELARFHQVLCVTHLPQVAAFADTHFLIEP